MTNDTNKVFSRSQPMSQTVVLLILCLACASCKRTPVAPSLATPDPFHAAVRFLAYDGAPPKFSDMTFQVIAGNRTQFLKLGDTIPNTTIRLSDFDPATTELIVTDAKTNQRARLALAKSVNSPTQL